MLQEIKEGEIGAGASVEAKKRQLFRSIRDLLIFFANARPIIMVVEDIQWVDASTRALLSYLVRTSERAPLFVLCAGRSDPGQWAPGLPDHLILLEPLSELPKVLSAGREGLAEALEGLENGGVIAKLESRERYRFRQQMIRDTAYHTLLHRDRKYCHHLLGETMENLHRDNLSTHLASLAYHFYEAENWSKALGYTLEAGAQARRSYACEEALICFDRALEILTRSQPDGHEEMALQLLGWKGRMHSCLGQREKAMKAFEAQLSKARSVHDRPTEAEACFRIGWISFYTHRPGRAREYLLKAIELSKEEDLAEMLLRASSFLGFTYSVLGKLEEAIAILISSLDLSMDLKDTEGKAWNAAYLLQYYNWTGEFEEALHLNEELKNLNRELKSPYFNIFQHFTAGLILGSLGRTEEARQSLETGYKQLEAGDDRFWRPRFLNTLGWVSAEEGNIEDALKLNRQALEEAIESGDAETIYNAEINLGENYLAVGNLSEASKILEKTWLEVRKPGVSYTRWRYETRLFIALGELYCRRGDRKGGLDFVQRAMVLSKRHGVRKHQARALLVRGRLLKETRPSLARRSLEKALSLSEKMGTRLLTLHIRRELEADPRQPCPRAFENTGVEIGETGA